VDRVAAARIERVAAERLEQHRAVDRQLGGHGCRQRRRAGEGTEIGGALHVLASGPQRGDAEGEGAAQDERGHEQGRDDEHGAPLVVARSNYAP